MGRDKALMPYPGGQCSMVGHTVAVVASRCAPVFVIAAAGQQLPDLDAEVLRDEVPGLGPLPATGRGLRAAAEAACQWAFVSAVDMPNLSADIVDLLGAHLGDDTDVVLPWDGRDHYLAGLYRTGLADRIQVLAAGGARSMRVLTDGVRTRRVVLDSDTVPAGLLKNVNAPGDL